MMMPGEKRGGFQRTVHPLLSVLKLFGVDVLEQNEWERDSLLTGSNGADGITWVITRVVRPTQTPFVGAYVHSAANPTLFLNGERTNTGIVPGYRIDDPPRPPDGAPAKYLC